MWTETSYVKIIHSSSLNMHVCTFTILCWLVCQWKNHIGSITLQEPSLFFGIRWIAQQNLSCSWLSVFPHSLHFALLCVKFIKCVNALPEADFYGGNAESCDEKGNRCVMCIYVFVHTSMISQECCFFSEFSPWLSSPLSLRFPVSLSQSLWILIISPVSKQEI